MGSLGGAEILIIFFLIVGVPILIGAAVLLSRARGEAPSRSTGENAITASELRELISAVTSESLSSFETKLLELDERLTALEETESPEQQQGHLGGRMNVDDEISVRRKDESGP